jgi:hypothetical protein
MSVTILHNVCGVCCEFEGEDWEDADPDVGMEGGYCSWILIGGTDGIDQPIDEARTKELSDFVVNDETIGDAVLVKLNCARMEADDPEYLDGLDHNGYKGS